MQIKLAGMGFLDCKVTSALCHQPIKRAFAFIPDVPTINTKYLGLNILLMFRNQSGLNRNQEITQL